jgi:hypothetical protein
MELADNQYTIHGNAISACLFMTNIYHLYNKGDNVYLYSFIMLFISSILYHQTYNVIWKRFDEGMIYNIIYQGGYRTVVVNEYNTYTMYTIICFILTLYTYYCKIYEGDSTLNHALLHGITSIGHHMIIANQPYNDVESNESIDLHVLSKEL